MPNTCSTDNIYLAGMHRISGLITSEGWPDTRYFRWLDGYQIIPVAGRIPDTSGGRPDTRYFRWLEGYQILPVASRIPDTSSGRPDTRYRTYFRWLAGYQISTTAGCQDEYPVQKNQAGHPAKYRIVGTGMQLGLLKRQLAASL